MNYESGDIIDLRDYVAEGQLFRSHADRGVVEAYIPAAGVENHAPNFAILPNGDLLCAWFAGEKEGMSSIRPVMSRLPAGSHRWQTPVDIMLDPERAQQNPVLFVEPGLPADHAGRVRAFFTSQQTRGCALEDWEARVARGEAEGPFYLQGTAVIRQRVSEDGGRHWGPVATPFHRSSSFCRQPLLVMSNNEWLFPMYYSPDDGSGHLNDYCVAQISADHGQTWREYPMQGSKGRVHASVVELTPGVPGVPGELVAFMRSRSADRIYRSRSVDFGRVWTQPEPTPLPNNNSSIQCYRLASGRLAIVFNRFCARDTQAIDRAVWPQERHPVTIALSEDGGITWPWVRDIDMGDGFRGDANRHLNRQDAYPCITQTDDALIHVAYSYRGRQCIKYARFTEAWICGAEKNPGIF